MPNQPATSPQTQSLRFSFDYTGAPLGIEILFEGVSVLIWTPENPVEMDGQVPVNAEGSDLVVRARWPNQERQALRIRVSNHTGQIVDQTFWGSGEWEDVLVIPGETR